MAAIINQSLQIKRGEQMKGYAPNFDINPKSELNSKTKQKHSFIELGVKQKCDKNCECKNCKEINQK